MTYTVRINFGGYIGAEEEYKVDANSEEEALEEAREIALDECSFEIIECEEE